MSQMIEGPRKTFLAAAAIGVNLRVKITDATTAPPTVNVAGASDPSIGVTEAAVLAAGPVAVLLANAQGTRKMVATEAITGGNTVYAAASGKVASTGTVVEGKAMETTTADDDIFEVLGTHNSDISTAIVGTTGVTFEVDTDSSTPKIALLAQAAGTGDFTTTLKPEVTLSGDNAIIVPESDGDTLAALALAQTFTATQSYGVDGTGIDLNFFGDTASEKAMWDYSADAFLFTALVSITGQGSTVVPCLPIAAQQTLAAGGGAVTITEYYTAGASDAGGDAWTLVDGAQTGQLKKIQLITDGGGDATLTPTTLTGGTTIVFADAGDFAVLCWSGTSWVAIELGNDADGASKPVLS